MNSVRVIFTPDAEEDLGRLAAAVQTRILSRLAWLGEHARLLNHQAMHGAEWAGHFRFRVGDYRVIYQLDRAADTLTVVLIGHRREGASGFCGNPTLRRVERGIA